MQEFNIGDKVQLKSGGPVMTVQADLGSFGEGQKQYKCKWFAGNKLQSGDFAVDALELVEDETN